MTIEVDFLKKHENQWAWNVIKEEWVSLRIMVHGNEFNVKDLPGLIAYLNKEKVGLLYYKIEDEICEIITINTLIRKKGIGTALLHTLEAIARKRNVKTILVSTTNDNINALTFYQKRGFMLNKVRKNIISDYRKVNPDIPLISENKIPLRDEIELIKLFSHNEG